MNENILEVPRLQLALPTAEEEEEAEEEERETGWYHSFTSLSFWSGEKEERKFLTQLQKHFHPFVALGNHKKIIKCNVKA